MQIIAYFVGAFFVGFPIYWLYNKMKSPRRDKDLDNPYILNHKYRQLNDRNYEAYLKWLDKTKGELPIKKELSEEELKFEQEIKNSLK
jgi:hypothetical protein